MASEWHFPGEERRQKRYSPWFLAAWTFLVVVVAFGFFIQARLIHDVHQQSDDLAHLVVTLEQQQVDNVMAICSFTLKLHDDEVKKVTRVFAQEGIVCVPKNGG